ncbi:hypothetical protein D3C80_1449680 [compost metagenome]
MHADLQRPAHVVAALADAGEDDLARLATGGQDAFQFAARDDVEAGAETCQHVQHAQVGVGLDGEADQVRHALQGIGVGVVLRLDVGARVDVGRRAEALGDGGHGHAFREQLTVAVDKGLHGTPLEKDVSVAFLCRFPVIRQVQRAFLATACEQGRDGDERDKGSQQPLHGEVLVIKHDCAGVYRPPDALPMRRDSRPAGLCPRPGEVRIICVERCILRPMLVRCALSVVLNKRLAGR